MNQSLFEQLQRQLSPEEEGEVMRAFAAAYREHEASERRPEVERITKLIRERLDQGEMRAEVVPHTGAVVQDA
jgi:hypothetical protein